MDLDERVYLDERLKEMDLHKSLKHVIRGQFHIKLTGNRNLNEVNLKKLYKLNEYQNINNKKYFFKYMYVDEDEITINDVFFYNLIVYNLNKSIIKDEVVLGTYDINSLLNNNFCNSFPNYDVENEDINKINLIILINKYVINHSNVVIINKVQKILVNMCYLFFKDKICRYEYVNDFLHALGLIEYNHGNNYRLFKGEWIDFEENGIDKYFTIDDNLTNNFFDFKIINDYAVSKHHIVITHDTLSIINNYCSYNLIVFDEKTWTFKHKLILKIDHQIEINFLLNTTCKI